jgi:hypothetical protein
VKLIPIPSDLEEEIDLEKYKLRYKRVIDEIKKEVECWFEAYQQDLWMSTNTILRNLSKILNRSYHRKWLWVEK